MCESTADYEMRLYARYLMEMNDLRARIADAETELDMDTFGVSSPRIKSAEEAKYRNSPKVYMEDEALKRMESRDRIENSVLPPLRIEFALKRIFCYVIQKKLAAADLSDEDRTILYLRYFRGKSLREIAATLYGNKDQIAQKLRNILECLE